MGGLVRVARRPYPRLWHKSPLKGGGCDPCHPVTCVIVPRGTMGGGEWL